MIGLGGWLLLDKRRHYCDSNGRECRNCFGGLPYFHFGFDPVCRWSPDRNGFFAQGHAVKKFDDVVDRGAIDDDAVFFVAARKYLASMATSRTISDLVSGLGSCCFSIFVLLLPVWREGS